MAPPTSTSPGWASSPESDHTVLMGANTYRIMSNYHAAEGEPGLDVCDGIDDEWSGHRCVSSLPAPTGELSDPDVDPPPSRGELPVAE